VSRSSSSALGAIVIALELVGCGGSGSGSSGGGALVLPTPSAVPSGGNSGGVVTIAIPAAEPIICSPASVTFTVAQRTVITCASAGFSGPLQFWVADPAIASVVLAAGTYTLFYVSGLQAGATMLSLQTPTGGAGQLAITVDP
jgi:hypothetical protein